MNCDRTNDERPPSAVPGNEDLPGKAQQKTSVPHEQRDKLSAFYNIVPRANDAGTTQLVDEPVVEKATLAAKLPAKDTFRILIMDTVENTDQLKAACKDVGHDVVAAKSIEEAFAFLEGKDHADVIICAAYLEDESMFEFLKRLRSNQIHKDSMFMTLALGAGAVGVRLNDATERAGRLLGADAFVSMPEFNAKQLTEEIEKLLPLIPMLQKEKTEVAEREAREGTSDR